MTLLEKTRQRAALAQWADAGFLGDEVLALIRQEADIGKTSIDNFSVNEQDREKGNAVIEALKLEGFYAAWENEGRRRISVNWAVRLPR